MKMASIPAPVRIPAAVGAIQWIDGFQAVHANLDTDVSGPPLRALYAGGTYQKRPAANMGAPIIGYSRRHSGIGTSLLAFSFFAY
jgi:hypothetical protein